MFACLLLVFLMLIPTTISTPSAGDQGCKRGWFGEKCMYKCHCAQSISCDINGDCPDDEKCKTGFFGPGCQYVNLVTGYVSLETMRYIWDGDDSSCNPKVNATSVEVVLTKGFPFSWFRIFFKQEVPRLKEMNVTLNDAFQCDNKRTYRVSSTALDISCDTKILVKKLKITGAIARVVCTIEISGGRNVALKQKASQSSNYTYDIFKGLASRAVDGNTDNEFETDWSCSTTDMETDGPEWYLKFNRPQIIFRIVIYNRGGDHKTRFQGFSLKTFAEDRTETNYFKDTTQTASLVYEINLLSRVPVTSLMIKGGTVVNWNERLLTLCEVETYGETVCPRDTYGIYCNHNCQCHFVGVCNSITGICGQGCDFGTYGHNCSSVCSEKCLNSECSEWDGGCVQCVPGYVGRFCNTECPLGKYGHNCSLSCPPLCEDQLCDNENGSCLSCTGARIGPTCEDCPENYYGKNCYSQCSEFCLNRSCHYISGKCSPCMEGYSGYRCSQGQKPKTEYVYMLFLPLPILLVICCAGLCPLVCKRKRVKSDNQEGSGYGNGNAAVAEAESSMVQK